MSTSPHSLPRAFTLIEVLVTISIIVILFSIVFPLVATAREKARRTQCSSNLRQLGMAFQLYAGNHGDFLPHEDAGSGGEYPSDSCWFDLLDRFLDEENLSQVKQCPSFGGDENDHSYKMNSLLEEDDNPFYKIGTTRKERQTILLFDGRADNQGNRRQTKGTWRNAATRHDNGTNLLFLDGHVEWYLPRLAPSGGWADPSYFVWDWREDLLKPTTFQ